MSPPSRDSLAHHYGADCPADLASVEMTILFTGPKRGFIVDMADDEQVGGAVLEVLERV
jgi:hypothetical protein